jgi:hypothetical protein
MPPINCRNQQQRLVETTKPTVTLISSNGKFIHFHTHQQHPSWPGKIASDIAFTYPKGLMTTVTEAMKTDNN